MQKNFATYNTLMRHMRNSGINIFGSSQKQHLILEGYFHGYKGYRYSKQSKNVIPFSDYSQIRSVIEFDESLKAILYQPLMQLESAIKSIACDRIVTTAKSDSFSVIYETVISKDDKKQRLKVRDSIYASMTKRFCSGSQIVCHYYNQDNYVPLWAIFEELMLGEISLFLEALSPEIKLSISKELGIPKVDNTDGALLAKIVLVVKDLRNAIAHNKVIFDGRYKEFKKRTSISKMLENCTGIKGINFSAPIDDVILIIFIMKNLKFGKTQLRKTVAQLTVAVECLHERLPSNLFTYIVPPDTHAKLKKLDCFIKQQ